MGVEEPKNVTRNRQYPSALGLYRSDDPEVIRQHLLWAQEYGIDGFLVEWTGRESTNGRFMDDNLGLMREIIKDFPEIQFAIFYDQQIRFGDLDFGEPEKRQDFLKDFERFAEDNFSHPNYWSIGNQPVVVIYLTRAARSGYGPLLDDARERMVRASGLSPYIIGDDVWWNRRMNTIDYLDGVTAFNLHKFDEVMEVGGDVRDFIDLCVPLYDEMQRDAIRLGTSLIPSLNHAYNDEIVRSNLPLIPTWKAGKMPDYRQDMIYALEQSADLYLKRNPIVRQHDLAPVFINSFNEWPERTAVEPSSEIEAFNDLNFFATNRRLLAPAHGYEYMQGIKEGKIRIEKILRRV